MRLSNYTSLILVCAALLMAPLAIHATGTLLHAATTQPEDAKAAEEKKKLSPEERMQSRFPHPIRAGELIGLPVLDWDDSTIGYIQQVVRTPGGKIQLVVPYRRRLGWVRPGSLLDWGGRRLVAVPLEAVAILARQVASLDMPPEEFDSALTFVPSQAAAIPADEVISIALTRR